MSFIDIKPVRAIKINNKGYRSAHNAALAYADSATCQLNYTLHKRGVQVPQRGTEYLDWYKVTFERFYRRSHPIFAKYFQGK